MNRPRNFLDVLHRCQETVFESHRERPEFARLRREILAVMRGFDLYPFEEWADAVVVGFGLWRSEVPLDFGFDHLESWINVEGDGWTVRLRPTTAAEELGRLEPGTPLVAIAKALARVEEREQREEDLESRDHDYGCGCEFCSGRREVAIERSIDEWKERR